MKKTILTAALVAAANLVAAPAAENAVEMADDANLSFDAGADLRIRQEMMENVPGLPGGGVLSSAVRGGWKNHIRFRPRVWGELKAAEKWRIYLRLADEFRWNVHPYSSSTTWPDELIVDNLFLEGKGLFDGFLDLTVGRQDIYNLYGLDHVFVDGTPGDGSRSVYGDMARFGFQFAEDKRLDLFFLHDADQNELRWGTDRSRPRSMSGIAAGAYPEMDDWGWGAIWSGKAGAAVDYQIFALQKITEGWHDRNRVGHPWTRRETVGAKVVPHLTDEWSLQAEAMGQIGRNGDGAWLSGWSTYLGANWKKSGEGVRPYAKLGFHTMSGDENAADEEGGHHAWDPLFARGVNDSEMFLYGTHYGVAWWSNMMYLKSTAGLDLGRRHDLVVSCGPVFAQVNDGLGGGDGLFKGFLSQARYTFPIWPKAKDGRFEVFGHVLGELFNPGDYFETDKPAYFLRWQVEFKF